MSPTVRVLNKNDFEEVIQIFNSRESIFKSEISEKYRDSFWKTLPLYLDDNRKNNERLMLGAFRDGQLLCFAGMFFWQSLPCWTLTNLKTRTGTSVMGIRRNGLVACYRQMILVAEALGRYRHFFAAPVRGTDEKYGLEAFQRLIPELNRYDYVTEAFIPAKCQSVYYFEKLMVGLDNYDHDIHIRCGTLRQEFRDRDLLNRANKENRSTFEVASECIRRSS